MIARLAVLSVLLLCGFGMGIALSLWVSFTPAPEQILYARTERNTSDFFLAALDGTSARYPLIPRSMMGSSYGGMDCTPDGDQVAVSMAYTLVSIRLDGSIERVSLPPGWIGGVALAPDGTRLIITGVFPDHSPQVELYMLETENRQITRITENRLREVGVSWSPDGTRIAVNYLDERQGGSGIGIIDMVDSAALPATMRVIRVEPVTIETPDWSPDGTQLAFASGTTFGSSLYLMSVDSGSLTFLFRLGTPIIRVRWSANGRLISFNRLNVREGWQVFALDLETRLVRQFTYPSSGYQNINGCWVAAIQPDSALQGEAAS